MVADSRDVAAYFGKGHNNVLQDIDNLLIELGEGGVLNFQQTSYIEPQNGQTYRRFDMTRDGFTPSDGAAKQMKPDETMTLDLVEGYSGKRLRLALT